MINHRVFTTKLKMEKECKYDENQEVSKSAVMCIVVNCHPTHFGNLAPVP